MISSHLSVVCHCSCSRTLVCIASAFFHPSHRWGDILTSRAQRGAAHLDNVSELNATLPNTEDGYGTSQPQPNYSVCVQYTLPATKREVSNQCQQPTTLP